MCQTKCGKQANWRWLHLGKGNGRTADSRASVARLFALRRLALLPGAQVVDAAVNLQKQKQTKKI